MIHFPFTKRLCRASHTTSYCKEEAGTKQNEKAYAAVTLNPEHPNTSQYIQS